MISSAEEFKQLRESEQEEEYSRSAVEEAPLVVWRDVLSIYPELAFWVALNKTVPFVILAELSTNKDSKVRDMVARKRKLTEDLMFQLADDEDESVRLALANNSKVTKAVLLKLSNDSWAEVRRVANEKLAL